MTNDKVTIDYTNHCGERALRHILPINIDYLSTPWHPQEQWILDAFVDDRSNGRQVRQFALSDIHAWYRPDQKPSTVDASIAKQLQRSMELNARMKARLLEYRKAFVAPDDDVVLAIDSILKDEDPACFKATE